MKDITVIIEEKEVENLYLNTHYWRMPESMFMSEKESGINYLCRNPHLLFPAGFDEAIIFQGKSAIKKHIVGKYTDITPRNDALLLRRKSDKAWLYLDWIHDNYTPDSSVYTFSDENRKEHDINIKEYLAFLRNSSSLVMPGEARFWLPSSLGTQDFNGNSPPSTQIQSDLLRHINSGSVSLDSLDWHQFEYVVAEILERAGVKIIRTKKTRDGGRDIIALGEIIPGIESQLAIEITHRKVVGIDKFAQSAYKNKDFPLFMLVTSGRFSSGIIREVNKPENKLRMIIRDGVSTKSWIRAVLD
ncbi:MAG TPA: restriction endonuclease [Bosea sp. (in: a-proteobacteria)]|uniref:restriction endonuclease n=1 Tax=Bosea sp. (in: a-proteobacteria) TaxID=1871050 RepID=UPI002DDCBA7D|nr:restriction endonuclease [Bosea sp. (in: a-proteobacteria)]HEV2553233.1 restriction endonuclease [Bosea sp. (in: a-proteobacteria)]